VAKSQLEHLIAFAVVNRGSEMPQANRAALLTRSKLFILGNKTRASILKIVFTNGLPILLRLWAILILVYPVKTPVEIFFPSHSWRGAKRATICSTEA
jgi:hypothetical protein